MLEQCARRYRVTAVFAAPDADAFVEQVAVEQVGPGRRTGDSAAHLKLRQVDADRAAKERSPRAACAQHLRCPDPAMLGNDAGDAAGFEIEAANRATGEDRAPGALHGTGQGRGGFVRFRPAVARGEHAAGPANACAANESVKLGAAYEPRVDVMAAGACDPRFVAGKILFIAGGENAAAGNEADALADLTFETAPDAIGGDRHRQLTEVAALLAHPAPVASRLFSGDVALFADDDANSLAGEKPRGRNADDAATDDDDIAPRRYGSRCFDRPLPGLPDDGRLHQGRNTTMSRMLSSRPGDQSRPIRSRT